MDGEATTSFQVYLEEDESAELTFLYAANPGFDEMVITYDLQIRGPTLDLSTTLYEYEDVIIEITKE